MKDLGYGAGYQYDPDTPDGFSGQDYFPDEIERVKLYDPKEVGHEIGISARLEKWSDLRRKLNLKT